MIFFDTETCGLTGPIILIQYADGVDGHVHLHEVWHESTQSTIELIRRLCNDTVVAFNLSFDWFHINKLYNLLINVKDKNRVPDVKEMVNISIVGAKSVDRNTNNKNITRYCLKPKGALDLFLYSRKTEWQNLMDRRNIRIKRIPRDIAYDLQILLRDKIQLADIYFHRRPNAVQWEIDKDDGEFCDLVLKFAASGGLKALVSEIFKVQVLDEVYKEHLPTEHSYNPYYVGWDKVIYHHINYWHSNKRARQYAEEDVIYLQKLYDYWKRPEPNDDDSTLAICVGATRWRGFSVDVISCQRKLEVLEKKINDCEVNTSSPLECKTYLREAATPKERLLINDTDAKTLDNIIEWDTDVSKRARTIQKTRSAVKECDNLRKLISTGSFNPDFKVIGARSGRMSGGSEAGTSGGSLNPQGIQRSRSFRSLFRFAKHSEVLSGGDFESFEVTIAHGICRDVNLEQDLLSNTKFHAVFGAMLYDIPYDEIISSKGQADDMYTTAKIAAFAGIFYGAQPFTVARTAKVDIRKATSALDRAMEKYSEFSRFKESILSSLASLQQPGGLGTKVFFREPRDYIESFLGFKRYFSLENRIIRQLFELANKLPLDAKSLVATVCRSNRTQSKRGAICSALYACAFQVQAQVQRAGLNHTIQSPGAYITKKVQRRVWDLQPAGIHSYVVAPVNFHDEIMVAHSPSVSHDLARVVAFTVDEFKDKVPFLKIDWKIDMKNWSDS